MRRQLENLSAAGLFAHMKTAIEQDKQAVSVQMKRMLS
jgi:hypothetical protein